MKAVNLIPGDDRAGAVITAGRSGGGVFVIAGLLAGLALLVLLYGLADHQISHDRTEVASLSARTQQAQARAGALAPYTSFLQLREQRVQAVTALVDSRFDWAQAFHELGRVLPAGKVSLGSIEGSIGSTSSSSSSSSTTTTAAAAAAAATPAPTSSSSSSGASATAAGAPSVTSATPPGSIPVFKLTGCATNQAEVALMLQRLRLIEGVNEVSLQSSTQSGTAGGGNASGSGCEGGNPAFTAQVTFDALPAVPTANAGATASTVSSSASASTPANAAAASAPAAVPASTSSAGAVR